MKIAIFGATGGTGLELLQQALDRGYEVTAIVRRPEAIPLTHVRLRVVTGDIRQPNSFAYALQQQDAVHRSLALTASNR